MDLWDYHMKFVKKYKCNMPLTKSCNRDSCIGCQYGERRVHPQCDIRGCNETSIIMVDDHGVDTYLCNEHFKQWEKSELDLVNALKKTGVSP